MSQDLIITTRPLDDAHKDIADLNKAGIKALAAPMLEIIPLDDAPHNPPKDIDAIVLTSRHSVHHIGDDYFDLPCYCVGPSTAIAASEAGFNNIITGPDDGTNNGPNNGPNNGTGDGASLTAFIADQNKKHQNLTHVFWPSAVDTGFNIAHALAAYDIKTTRIPVYKAATCDHWPQEVEDALRHDDIAAILMHSGRAGEHFDKMMDEYGFADKKQNITAIVISERAARLCGQGWRDIKIAATPRRSAMFAATAEVLELPISSFNGDDLDQAL